MRLRNILFGASAACLISATARAHCQLPISFANYGYDPSTYTYVHFGADARQSNDAIIGRFWEAGYRGASNEGTYDDSQWLIQEAPDTWDFQGFLGTVGSVGCVRDEMILVLEDTTIDGSDAIFATGRVHHNGATEHQFPFWITGDWDAVKFPAACRVHQKRRGSRITVDLALDDIAAGFHGEPGMVPADTLTAYTVWLARGDADPGRSPAAWTLHATIPYAGAPGTLTGLEVDCSGPGDVFIAVGVEFDHGQFGSDFVGKSTRIVCDHRLDDPSDPDGDGTEARCDNCPDVSNAKQRDADGDGIGDACDRCPLDPEPLPLAGGSSPQLDVSHHQPCGQLLASPVQEF
jgi:hypothetical protein